MTLFYIQNDVEYFVVHESGRFSIDLEAARIPRHRAAAVRWAVTKMIADLAKRGFEYTGGSITVEGPLPHLEASDDDRPDLGPFVGPDIRDLAGQEQFEREEKARRAKPVDNLLTTGRVDFRVVMPFRKRRSRRLLPRLGTVLSRPTAAAPVAEPGALILPGRRGG